MGSVGWGVTNRAVVAELFDPLNRVAMEFLGTSGGSSDGGAKGDDHEIMQARQLGYCRPAPG